jgi:hypothetical protein
MSRVRIIEVLNIMVGNHEKITDVKKAEYRSEFFFKYLGKQVWSVWWPGSEAESIVVAYFPEAKIIDDAMQGGTRVEYGASDWRTQEGIDTFKDLYKTLEEKYFHVDAALDEIVRDSEQAR